MNAQKKSDKTSSFFHEDPMFHIDGDSDQMGSLIFSAKPISDAEHIAFENQLIATAEKKDEEAAKREQSIRWTLANLKRLCQTRLRQLTRKS